MARKALLVGINAYPSHPLNGCVNDVADLATLLTGVGRFNSSDIRLLNDSRATRAAVLERLNWLISDAQVGDQLFFHFSGHGVQSASRTVAGNVDAASEAICPVDFSWPQINVIRDTEFVKILAALPAGVRLTWTCDCCHAGGLDRRPILPADHSPRTLNPPLDVAWRLRTAAEENIRPLGLMGAARKARGVALFAACKSDELANDVCFDDRHNGAFTYFFLKSLQRRGGMQESLSGVLKNVRSMLSHVNIAQTPQLVGQRSTISQPFF